VSAPVHYRIEVLYDTLDGPACGFQARGRLTNDDAEVTCARCLAALGYAVPERADLTPTKLPSGRFQVAA
jgi:hypothetical protein